MEACHHSAVVKTDPFMNSVRELSLNVAKIKNSYRNTYPVDQYFNIDNLDPVFPNGMNLTFSKPLTISAVGLKAYYESIKKNVSYVGINGLKSWLFDGVEPIFKADESDGPGEYLDGSKRLRLRRYIQKIEGLDVITKRWRHSQCSLEYLKSKSYYDIRDYLELDKGKCPNGNIEVGNRPNPGDKKICLETLFLNWENLEKLGYENHKKKVTKLLISLCVSSGKSNKDCTLEFSRAKDKEILNDFYESYAKIVKEKKVAKFFDIMPHTPKFQCAGTFTKVMTVPIYINNHQIDYKPLLERISKEYFNSKKGFEVKFDFVQEYDPNKHVFIRFEKGAVSHVAHDDPLVITIGEEYKRNFVSLKSLLAHELGHVLGLPDCYVEFFNQKNELFYYYIEPQNLMCKIGTWSRFSSSAFEKIKKKKCL